MSPAANEKLACTIEEVEGTWPEPPQWFSYSSLKDAEMCPRRWALSRGTYPSIWDGHGYPGRPSIASQMGDVVHAVLERIVRALVQAGCESAQGEDAVPIMRSLGGFTELIRAQVNTQLRELSANPRVAKQLDWYRQSLQKAVPEMRRRAQALSVRVVLGKTRTEPTVRLTEAATARWPDGSYPERQIRSASLGFSGRIDLLTVARSTVQVVDYKTGDADPGHQEQLRTYAAIWAQRDDFDSTRPRVTRLTLSYVTRDVEVAPPTEDELSSLSDDLKRRASAARTYLEQSPAPPARPSEETCRYCTVRHLCDPFWTWLRERESDEEFTDLEMEIVAQNGPRSWQFKTHAGRGLLRTQVDMELPIGRTLRILGVAVGEDEGSVIHSLTSTSEIFRVRLGA